VTADGRGGGPGRRWVVPALLGAAVGGAGGSWLAIALPSARTASAAAPADDSALAALTSEVRALREHVARLAAGAAVPAAAPMAAIPPDPATRTSPAADPRNGPGELDRGADADDGWQRLEQFVRSLTAAEHPALATEALRRARLQNPHPNHAAVLAAHTLLHQQPDDTARRDVERTWWLLGMDEVVERLGMPGNVIAHGSTLLWEYFLPDDRALYISFRGGVVVSVSH
jgi:hypothetical protein